MSEPETSLEPIQIRLTPPVRILQATVTKRSRDLIALNVSDDVGMLRQGRVLISFRILEKGDGGNLQIIYAGLRETTAEIIGTVEGQGRPRNLRARLRVTTNPVERYQRARKTSNILVTLAGMMVAAVLPAMVWVVLRFWQTERNSAAWRSRLLLAVNYVVLSAFVSGLFIFLVLEWLDPTPPFGF